MDDAAVITTLFARLTAAWDAGDGAAYGACFTPDASYITYVGTLYRGAEEIGAAHQALFDSFLKGTRLACEIVDIRLTTPDTAVVITRGTPTRRPRASSRSSRRTRSSGTPAASGAWPRSRTPSTSP